MNEKNRFRRVAVKMSAIAALTLCGCMYGPAPYNENGSTAQIDRSPTNGQSRYDRETDDIPASDTLTENNSQD